MENQIYADIARRTEGDIYIGVVGPVRTGKSTFVKRFMETMVLPGIEERYRRERARDELPQSGSGRTIMTAEPKFVPEEAVELALQGGERCAVRLIDCVGYLVPGAIGQLEDGAPRMVTTPWADHPIPLAEAAETGTRKVIAEHSTVGLVVTTDGSVTDIPREDYLEAEERVITELQQLGKPFLILLNSARPDGEEARTLARELAERYQVTCLAVDCLALTGEDMAGILQEVLREFPVKELAFFLPAWVDALPLDHPVKARLFDVIRQSGGELHRMRDVERVVAQVGECEEVSRAGIQELQLGSGVASAQLELPRRLFYDTLSDRSGFRIGDDGDLVELLGELARMKAEYDKVAQALQSVRETGYGIVVPSPEELVLEDPEIVRQGGRYGVRLRASAPSIHMVRRERKRRREARG